MDWGNGILQRNRDYLVLKKLDKDTGLFELSPKLNIKSPPEIDGEGVLNRYSSAAEYCFGIASVPISRKYLDSGPLVKAIEDIKVNLVEDEETAIYQLTIITAGAMTLGCTIPEDVKKLLVNNPSSGIVTLARAQMKMALANYKNGIPYDFANTSRSEALACKAMPYDSCVSKFETINHGWQKIIKVYRTFPPSESNYFKHVVGPTSTKESKEEEMHAYNVCGNCGAKGTDSGAPLPACGACKGRRYCSAACQKKHWKKHKVVCRTVIQEMVEEMQATFHDEVENGSSALSNKMAGMKVKGTKD